MLQVLETKKQLSEKSDFLFLFFRDDADFFFPREASMNFRIPFNIILLKKQKTQYDPVIRTPNFL